MIKRDTTAGERVVVTYVCDNCVKEMPGAPILVYYPYGHINDSLAGPSHFCSDKCVVEYQEKTMKKFGPWKSTKTREKLPSSDTWRSNKSPRPKARRVVRKTKSRKKSNKKRDNQKGNK